MARNVSVKTALPVGGASVILAISGISQRSVRRGFFFMSTDSKHTDKVGVDGIKGIDSTPV